MTKEINNIAASVKARLKRIAEAEAKPFDFLLMMYMIERLLYRLSISEFRDHFVLKGGLLLYIQLGDQARPTRDLDFLAQRLPSNADQIAGVFRRICEAGANDGLRFATDSITAGKIKEGADYEGVRINIDGYLEKSKKKLQLDIGFGDIVIPKPVMLEYPVLLEMKAPELQAYSMESVVAEKFEAMLALAAVNSRMKDFYDVFSISERFDFDGRVLSRAVSETLRRRGTHMPEEPVIFTSGFCQDHTKKIQWEAFIKRISKEEQEFEAILHRIKHFLEPVYDSILMEREFVKRWSHENKSWI
jgi:predicted nucleotidyltransferase component of viral defense system